jgi:hypothetical protein
LETVVDLLIVDGGLVFDAAGEPVLVSGAAAIAQDVAHRVRESGTAELLIAEDDAPALAQQRIADVVEEDLRIQPGTVVVTGPDAGGRVLIRGTLMDGQPLAVVAEQTEA